MSQPAAPENLNIRVFTQSRPRLCENALGQRMRRIVFSIASFRTKLPAQPTPTSTKSRWKFYTEVGDRSFHTAWTQRRHLQSHEPTLILNIRGLGGEFGEVC